MAVKTIRCEAYLEKRTRGTKRSDHYPVVSCILPLTI